MSLEIRVKLICDGCGVSIEGKVGKPKPRSARTERGLKTKQLTNETEIIE